MSIETRIKDAVRDVPDFPKPGIIFKDITPLFFNQQLCKNIVDSIVESLGNNLPDKVAAIESRGFLFGIMLANRLNIPFVPIRKAGKLPFDTYSYSYELEYGQATVEIHVDAVMPGDKVLIHDDLLATGGTAGAAAHLVEFSGGVVSGFSFIINLSFLNGKEALNKYSSNFYTLATY